MIITSCHISKKHKVNQGCMFLSTFYLEDGRHLARLHRRRRRRAYAPTSNTASRDNHEKINSWVSLCFPYGSGAPLGGPRAAGAPLLLNRCMATWNTSLLNSPSKHGICNSNTKALTRLKSSTWYILPSAHPAKKLCSAASITTAVTPVSNTIEHKRSPELKSYN